MAGEAKCSSYARRMDTEQVSSSQRSANDHKLLFEGFDRL